MRYALFRSRHTHARTSGDGRAVLRAPPNACSRHHSHNRNHTSHKHSGLAHPPATMRTVCTPVRSQAAGRPSSKRVGQLYATFYGLHNDLHNDPHKEGRACTMARARAAGSPLLKIPLPTNTPSMPICIIIAASAGVATPPAAKFTTGKRPSIFVCGRQTCSTLQQHTSNRHKGHTHNTAHHQ